VLKRLKRMGGRDEEERTEKTVKEVLKSAAVLAPKLRPEGARTGVVNGVRPGSLKGKDEAAQTKEECNKKLSSLRGPVAEKTRKKKGGWDGSLPH